MGGIQIGRLRERVMLEVNTPTVDPVDGAHIDHWTVVDTVWGEVLGLSGREYLSAREVHAEVTVRITIRHRSDVEPLLWRATVGGVVYNIQHVVDLAGRRRHLELWVSRIL